MVPRVALRQGCRRYIYRDSCAELFVPVLAAAVSRENLFDLFLTLLEPLGPTVDVVLETSHEINGPGHKDLLREEIDLPVLLSHFYDFEDLLINDGCAGVAVIANDEPMEVQFEEHKMLVVYAQDLSPFEAAFQRFGVRRDDDLKFINEEVHVHFSAPRYLDEFEQMCCRIGVAEPVMRVNF